MDNFLGFSVEPLRILLGILIVILTIYLVRVYIVFDDIVIKALASLVLLPILTISIANLL